MRALPIVFVFSLLLAAACGSDSEDSQSTTGPQATPDGSTSTAGSDATASVSGDATVAEDSQGPTARPEPATPADLHRQVLSGLAESVIIPTLEAFAESTSALQQAAYAHAGDLSAESLADVQQAWHTSMGLWQQAEVMQIGPTASMSAAPEGMDMRDEVYSWPTVNTCRIDQEITEDAHADQAVFATELANVRGLDALEYLLFAEELENSCSANSGINKKGTWEDLLTAGELPARRAAYILTAASLLENVTQSILTAWRKDGGDFHTSFATAGAGSEVYDSAQQALNRVSDALFYVEKQTKDMKLALPAGVGGGCDDDACPEYLESTFAMASKEHILNNLAGARYLMIGSRDEAADALGLLDVLEDAGAADLGADMLARLDEANSFISSIEGPLAEALSTNPEIVVEAHDKVKAFSDLLKTEFITTLDLDIPKRAAGDND